MSPKIDMTVVNMGINAVKTGVETVQAGVKGVDLMLRNSSFVHRDRLSSSAWVKCGGNCHLM